MRTENLRHFIEEEQRVEGDKKPDSHAVANFLAAFQAIIFAENGSKGQGDVLSAFGYEYLSELQEDATQLVRELYQELGDEEWEVYFRKRRNLLD